MDFLWHKVSEKEKEDIKNQAKDMMDSFEKELKKVESEKADDFFVGRKGQMRPETKASCDASFRKIFFENAPSKDGDFIKAEKGGWKK